MLVRKDQDRFRLLCTSLDSRVRNLGVRAPEAMVEQLRWLRVHPRFWERAESARPCDASEVYVIVEEGQSIPQDGIEFDVQPKHVGNMTKSLLQSVRRLHINCGHPPNADLERVVRLSGGSELACQAVRAIKCSICNRSANAKLPRPGRVRDNIGQFNDTVLCDLGYVKDAVGATHAFMIFVDDGTDYIVARRVDSHQATEFYKYTEESWINWAGPPDLFIADGERGSSSEQFDWLGTDHHCAQFCFEKS